jgi:HSP20 family protein
MAEKKEKEKEKKVQEVKATAIEKPAAARADVEATRGERYVTPAVDIFETEDGLVLAADVPGVAQDGIDLHLEDRVLEITAHRRGTDTNGEYDYVERKPASYYRAFSVSDDIDLEKIEAKLEHGVLSVTLPKSAKAKPRKIEVKAR